MSENSTNKWTLYWSWECIFMGQWLLDHQSE